MRNHRHSMAGLAMLLCAPSAMASAPVWLSQFTRTDIPPPAPWQTITVSAKLKPTTYRLIKEDDVIGIEALANSSMSMLGRPLPESVTDMPILCWRWRIDAPLRLADMTKKAGDDYAARVYIALKVPPGHQSFSTSAKLKIARTLYGPQIPDAAINYVWDNKQPVGTLRANAYTNLTQMIVVNSGAAQAGHWVEVRRDLDADIGRAFPASEAIPTMIAIASDTDNTGERARSVFADFHMVPRGQACAFAPVGTKP